MAGRGRGRGGRGKGLSINVESLGFDRGQALPPNTFEPPPSYPDNEVKAVPLAKGDRYSYLLALKQEYRANMKESIYYIKLDEKRKDIERYSDKFQLGQQANKQGCIVWSSLPKELRPRKDKKRKAEQALETTPAPDVLKTLEQELEKKEGGDAVEEEAEEEDEEPDAKKKKTDEDAEDEEEDIPEDTNEDELEDETDYAMNYFDNGENFGADEDDDLEEDAYN